MPLKALDNKAPEFLVRNNICVKWDAIIKTPFALDFVAWEGVPCFLPIQIESECYGRET